MCPRHTGGNDAVRFARLGVSTAALYEVAKKLGVASFPTIHVYRAVKLVVRLGFRGLRV